MMLLFPMLLACSNFSDPATFLLDGERHASGVAAVFGADSAAAEEEGGEGGGGDEEGGDPAAPRVSDITGEWVPSGTQTYLRLTILLTDTQGDLDGGRVIYTVTPQGGAASDETVTIAEGRAPSPGSTAGFTPASGTLLVLDGPRDATKQHVVSALVIRDEAGHLSTEQSVTVAARSSR
jgi:hypothetical protein